MLGLVFAVAATAVGVRCALGSGQPDRVVDAYRNAEPAVKKLCAEAGIQYPPKRIFIRSFKSERELELWGSNGPRSPFKLLQTYPIAGISGGPGPKRREGDRQVPEGFYYIDRFNPFSKFHMSLGLNYPNASDRILSDKAKPGGDIFIHGNNVSIGCMAMTDPKIEQIYILALEAKNQGQCQIPVHVFPFRMTGEWPAADKNLETFWKSLDPIYQAFEKTKFVPGVSVDSLGRYKLKK